MNSSRLHSPSLQRIRKGMVDRRFSQVVAPSERGALPSIEAPATFNEQPGFTAVSTESWGERRVAKQLPTLDLPAKVKVDN